MLEVKISVTVHYEFDSVRMDRTITTFIIIIVLCKTADSYLAVSLACMGIGTG